MTSQITIRPQDRAIVRDILVAALPSENRRIFVFGSRARGTQKRAADLDLAIDLGRPMSREEQSQLADQFEESDLPYRVDIIDLHTVSARFKAIVAPDFLEFELD
jgi:predicted nucleotidyltransferase